MNEAQGSQLPIFSHVEPVLAVRDLVETISYWHNILGFPNKWTWGEPPIHGGVSWQKAFFQFSQDQPLATLSQGNSIWIRLQHLESLYSFHQSKNADIVAPLEKKPWGMTEYTVREINGYFLHFATPTEDRKKPGQTSVTSFRIVNKLPTTGEYRNLTSAVGWPLSSDDHVVEAILSAPIFAVVAENAESSEVIGCALLLGDHASFYYVKDVIVNPAWQGKGVGTAMMQALTGWLQEYGASNALVSLITREGLESFYQRFNFIPAFSMIRHINTT